jgi:hypothetical protein
VGCRLGLPMRLYKKCGTLAPPKSISLSRYLCITVFLTAVSCRLVEEVDSGRKSSSVVGARLRHHDPPAGDIQERCSAIPGGIGSILPAG